ncbi:MAG: T9SS type A sorting domain-containing protein [Bacteroides sp.]|nr:T9SS type A sorting domain-containing protein [Bacteroides sp.]MCM1085174.1 T9SS type A sorting domain-containing protein [Bacteroides sp.]
MKAKSIITTLILSVSGVLTVFAQEVKPNVVQEGRLWSFNRNVGGLNPEEYQPTGENIVSFFGKDTVIDGNTYKNVLYKKVLYWDNFDLLPVRHRGTALREENQKLYLYDYATKMERVMCDFSLKPGDTIDAYEEFRVVATGDTVFFEGGKKHKYIKLEVRSETSIEDFWVEGIGSLSVGIEWDGCWNCPGSNDALLCCRDGDRNLYEKTEKCLLNVDEATFEGKIDFVGESPEDVPEGEPVLPCLWPVLQTEKDRYFLMKNGVYDCDLVVDGIRYEAGDEVEIRGIASIYRRNGLQSDLEILSIKKKGNVGVETTEKAELRIFPNPAGETVTLTATGCNLQKVEILDMNGRVLYAATLDNQTSFRYNVSWMSSGIYFARVKTPCGVLTEKFSVR